MNIAIKEMQINEAIRDSELRVIAGDGEMLGIMSAAEALKIAEEKNLDLVKIAPQAKPPVCKIMDYSKYRFEQAKRELEKGDQPIAMIASHLCFPSSQHFATTFRRIVGVSPSAWKVRKNGNVQKRT